MRVRRGLAARIVSARRLRRVQELEDQAACRIAARPARRSVARWPGAARRRSRRPGAARRRAVGPGGARARRAHQHPCASSPVAVRKRTVPGRDVGGACGTGRGAAVAVGSVRSMTRASGRPVVAGWREGDGERRQVVRMDHAAQDAGAQERRRVPAQHVRPSSSTGGSRRGPGRDLLEQHDAAVGECPVVGGSGASERLARRVESRRPARPAPAVELGRHDVDRSTAARQPDVASRLASSDQRFTMQILRSARVGVGPGSHASRARRAATVPLTRPPSTTAPAGPRSWTGRDGYDPAMYCDERGWACQPVLDATDNERLATVVGWLSEKPLHDRGDPPGRVGASTGSCVG